jgi:hypothetical protein
MKKLIVAFGLLTLTQGCKTGDFTGGSDRAAARPPMERREFNQDTREIRQVQVKQGTKGSNGNENYNVTAQGIVDIVVVVDNSGSMEEEQANLATKLTPLLSAIKSADWQIVVTSTTDGNNCRPPIVKGEFNVEGRFERYVRDFGINGDGTERSIYKAVEALKGDCFPVFTNRNWLRPNSTVAVLILTDEDNCHTSNTQGYGCAGEPAKDGAYLTNYLSSIRKLGVDGKVYGIYWSPTQSSQSQCPTGMKTANIVADVVAKTGGTWGSICDSDYSGTLTRISTDLAKVLKADFVLKSTPDNGTFKLTVNGQPWTAYTISGRSVRFTTNPPEGAAIQVSYVSGAAGVVTNKFSIPDPAVDGSITATANGKSAGSVSYDAGSRQAVFAQTPPDGSAIVLSYKAATPLKTMFMIAPDADVSSVIVLVNGANVDKSKYTYDSKSGAVTFKEAPPESAKISIMWRGKKIVT